MAKEKRGRPPLSQTTFSKVVEVYFDETLRCYVKRISRGFAIGYDGFAEDGLLSVESVEGG
jgi:hypothetical protein